VSVWLCVYMYYSKEKLNVFGSDFIDVYTDLFIYMYICICICICVYVYIYICV
jgi:hypothetical protein